MIKPEQVPPEVACEALNAYAAAIWDADAKPLDYQHAITSAIAAALNAWPGMDVERFMPDSGPYTIHLPLPPQEASDAKAYTTPPAGKTSDD